MANAVTAARTRRAQETDEDSDQDTNEDAEQETEDEQSDIDRETDEDSDQETDEDSEETDDEQETEQSAPAITLALERARQEHLIDNINFTYTWRMCDCYQPRAVGYATQLMIGPPCVTSAIAAGYVASFYNIPLYLWGATASPALCNTTIFPTVNNVNVNAMKAALKTLSNRSRIVVGCFDVEVDRRNFLLSIFDTGLAESNEFVFIIGSVRNQGMFQQVPSGSDGTIKYANIWIDKNNPSDGRDSDALAATRHVILVDLESQSDAQINEFGRNLTAKFGTSPFFCNGSCMGDATEQSPSQYHVRVRIQSNDLKFLRKLRQLDHDNLNKFYGVCIDGPLLYGIWKHCQRGTLKELIAKEQYVGDNFVMFTLMRDIASGLIAIHQSFVVAHGLFTSENCLINDRQCWHTFGGHRIVH